MRAGGHTAREWWDTDANLGLWLQVAGTSSLVPPLCLLCQLGLLSKGQESVCSVVSRGKLWSGSLGPGGS